MSDHPPPTSDDEIRKALRAVTRRFERAENALEQARNEAQALAIEALKRGFSPTEVADLSPYAPTRLRQIARAAGLPPVKTKTPRRRPASGRLSGGESVSLIRSLRQIMAKRARNRRGSPCPRPSPAT